MASNFTRAEQTIFDEVVEGFDDALVIGKLARTFNPLDAEEQARSGDRFWLPMPQISASYDGFDQTANFGDLTELSVPVTIGYHKVVPQKFSSKDLRVESSLRNRGNAARQKLASDVNMSLYNTVALQGSVFVKRTVAPTGFDDISLADAALTEVGVPLSDRVFVAAPRVANAMAGNLASRATDNARDATAYEKAMISTGIAGFDVFKNDQSIRLAAATGGAVTVGAANQYHEPEATSTAATGEVSNVDNRYSDLVLTAAVGNYANIKVGDAFTIAGVNSVNMITKQDTGQLQTFRVISKPAADTIRIAPAIISNGGSTRAGAEYQNVTATPAAGAAITWLNTTTAELNPFFVRDSLLLVPGSYAVDPEDGWQVMRATTDLGIGITYTRQGEINDLSVKARWEVDYGTSLLNPQFAGVEMFNQA
jgi:hypothetical protein